MLFIKNVGNFVGKYLFLHQQKMKHSITTKLVLNHRFQRKDGTFAVALRVTYLRNPKLFTIPEMYLTKSDFEKIQTGKARAELKEMQIKLNAIEARAKEIIESLSPFSFELFKEQFEGRVEFQKQVIENDVFVHLEKAIIQLKTEKREGTASSYKCSLSSLQAFTNRNKLSFNEITVEFLKKYEEWMAANGNSNTTIGIYLRNVRTVYHKAIIEGIVTNEQKPFGRGKYTIPTGNNVKKALTKTDVERIVNYEVKENSSQHFARDMWYFSYLSNGMNMKDIALLKYKNIEGNKLTFQRAKTAKTTKGSPKMISVILQPKQQEIIKRWANEKKSPETFLFPILTEDLSASQERNTIKQKTKLINKYMKEIGKTLGLELLLTTYVARHSFATVLKRGGAPLQVISEMLGHTDLKTTENYLDSFDDETLEGYAKLLT